MYHDNHIILALCILLLISCKPSQTNNAKQKTSHATTSINLSVDFITYAINYKNRNSTKSGFLNDQGEVVIEPIFNNCSNFLGDYANVILNSDYGYMDKSGNYKLFKDYDKVYWYYSDIGFAIKDTKFALLKRDGTLLTDFNFDTIYFPNENYFPVVFNGNKNYITEKGILVFNDSLNLKGDPVFDNMTTFYASEKTKSNNKPKVGLITMSGKVIISPIYDELYGYFSNGVMIASLNGKYGLIDKNETVVVPFEYDEILNDYENSLLVVQKDKKYGAITIENELTIPLIYDRLSPFKNGLALAYRNKKAGYINTEHEIKIPFDLEYTWQGTFRNGLAIFKENNRFGFIDTNGSPIIPAIYESTSPFTNKHAVIKRGELKGLINKEGKLILKPTYQEIWLDDSDDSRIRFTEKID